MALLLRKLLNNSIIADHILNPGLLLLLLFNQVYCVYRALEL